MIYVKNDQFFNLNDQMVDMVLQNHRVKDIAHKFGVPYYRVRHAMNCAGVSTFYVTAQEARQIMEQRKKNRQDAKDQQVMK